MKIKSQIFRSSTKSWEDLCNEAAEWASQLQKDRLINISVAAAGGSDAFGFGSKGVIVVWYWD
jgi:hypothetical protein